MSEQSKVGQVGWIDITVDDATGLGDFYKDTVADVDESATAALFQP